MGPLGAVLSEIENPRVGGSIPSPATIFFNDLAHPRPVGFFVVSDKFPSEDHPNRGYVCIAEGPVRVPGSLRIEKGRDAGAWLPH